MRIEMDPSVAAQTFGRIPQAGSIVEYPFRSNRRWDVSETEYSIVLTERPPITKRQSV